MSKKKDDEEDIAKLIEDPAQFAKISGNDYEKDMLHVVEIFCTWCGPSDAVKSTYKRLAVELKGRKVKFYKVRPLQQLATWVATALPVVQEPCHSSLDAERMPPRTGACSAQHPDPLVCMRPPLVQMDAKLVPGFEKQALTSKPFFAIYKDGEIIEQVEGINTPLLEKFIGDTIPEGILEIEEEPAEGDEDD